MKTLLPTRVYLSFSVHKLANVSSNPGKVHFKQLVHLLRYIRDNKTLGLKYYADTNDAPVSEFFRQASIITKNQFMAFSNSSQQDFPDTSRSTGAYIIFYQGGQINHGTHVPGPVAQLSAESEYNKACTAGMYLSHFMILIHELLNKDPYIVTEESYMIILYSKSSMCKDINGKDTKNTM